MERVAFWRTKAAISQKRVKIEEKLRWTAYRNSRYYPRPHTVSPKIGVRSPHSKLKSKISGKRVLIEE